MAQKVEFCGRQTRMPFANKTSECAKIQICKRDGPMQANSESSLVGKGSSGTVVYCSSTLEALARNDSTRDGQEV